MNWRLMGETNKMREQFNLTGGTETSRERARNKWASRLQVLVKNEKLAEFAFSYRSYWIISRWWRWVMSVDRTSTSSFVLRTLKHVRYSFTKTQTYSSSAYSFKVINKLLTLELEKEEQTFRCAMETLRKRLRFTWFSRTLSLCPFNFLVTSIPSCIIRYTNKHAYTKHTEEFPHP